MYISRAYDEPRLAAGRASLRVATASWLREPAWDGAGVARLMCKIRHGPGRHACTVTRAAGQPGALHVALDQPDHGIAPGQIAVFYDGELCCGSGAVAGPEHES